MELKSCMSAVTCDISLWESTDRHADGWVVNGSELVPDWRGNDLCFLNSLRPHPKKPTHGKSVSDAVIMTYWILKVLLNGGFIIVSMCPIRKWGLCWEILLHGNFYFLCYIMCLWTRTKWTCLGYTQKVGCCFPAAEWEPDRLSLVLHPLSFV